MSAERSGAPRYDCRSGSCRAVAGSGMLGFTGFSVACKAFQTAPEDKAFAERLETLKQAAAFVTRDALRLAEQPASLVPANAA